MGGMGGGATGGGGGEGGPTLQENVPSEFLCGINQHIMRRPMRAPSGHMYDAESIHAWLEEVSHVCPMTGCELRAEVRTHRLTGADVCHGSLLLLPLLLLLLLMLLVVPTLCRMVTPCRMVTAGW